MQRSIDLSQDESYPKLNINHDAKSNRSFYRKSISGSSKLESKKATSQLNQGY